IVGAMIVRAGLKFGWAAIRELIDTGLSAEEVAAIRNTIATTPGVLGLHELRTRRMAHQVLVDAHVQVNPRISVSEGHRIAEAARQRVLDSHPEVLDVLVHVDAENDLLGNAATLLPDRNFLLEHLRTLLDADPPDFERTTLHYLGTRVEAEIFLPPGFADEAGIARIRQRLEASLPSDPWFITIHLNQRIAPK
ncbi:MAG: cation transporter dimerization domain-containing protein, partial [Sulfuritalea sp.]|nr:cation transporter dimerization domain-containing protein [Sulfuritalea sp.]